MTRSMIRIWLMILLALAAAHTGCTNDCGSKAITCGDGVCSSEEDCLACLADCDCACGDGACTFGEFCAVCPEDCDCESPGATPPMGWNSWNRFHCDIDEDLVRETADAMVASGMRDAGYRYLNLDDCWQSGRAPDGTIVADPDRFPSGIPALADYVHARGLKFGLYTCAGTLTCQERPGSYGYEHQDMQTYADWDVDYVKVDWCFTEGLDPRDRYPIFRDAIDAAGGGIVLSICDWGRKSPWVFGPGTGELWRTTWDIADAAWSMLLILEVNQLFAPFAGPGAWNDPDMLEVGNGGMDDRLYRTHFGLWSIMAAPLIAGNDLAAMSESARTILINPEVIAVDQDPSGIQGRRIARDGGVELWVKPLTLDGARAVALFNASFGARNVMIHWVDVGLAHGSTRVRDLWTHEDLGVFDANFSADLEPFETKMLLVLGNEHPPPEGETPLSTLPWKYSASFLSEVRCDQSAGGNPISIAGVEYDHGLGAAAGSLVLYHLAGRCTSFSADVGVDDETRSRGSALFQVWSDGELLLDSGIMTRGEAARPIAVDLTGRRELELRVRPGDDFAFGDHTDWADALLTCN